MTALTVCENVKFCRCSWTKEFGVCHMSDDLGFNLCV